MKKPLLGIFIGIILGSFINAQQDENLPSTPMQKEEINLPITKAPTQDISTESSDDKKIEEKPKPEKKQNENQNLNASNKTPPKKSNPTNTATQPTKNSPKASKDNKVKKVVFIQEEFYDPKKEDISVEKKSQTLILNIHSKELQRFMEGGLYESKQQVQTFGLEDSFTQITNINGKIYEYKYAQKSIDRYSTIATYENYPLKKLSTNQYQILIKKIPPIFVIKGCKIVIKKEVSGTLNQTQEVIINLDAKRELRNKSYFDLFLECPR